MARGKDVMGQATTLSYSKKAAKRRLQRQKQTLRKCLGLQANVEIRGTEEEIKAILATTSFPDMRQNMTPPVTSVQVETVEAPPGFSSVSTPSSTVIPNPTVSNSPAYSPISPDTDSPKTDLTLGDDLQVATEVIPIQTDMNMTPLDMDSLASTDPPELAQVLTDLTRVVETPNTLEIPNSSSTSNPTTTNSTPDTSSISSSVPVDQEVVDQLMALPPNPNPQIGYWHQGQFHPNTEVEMLQCILPGHQKFTTQEISNILTGDKFPQEMTTTTLGQAIWDFMHQRCYPETLDPVNQYLLCTLVPTLTQMREGLLKQNQLVKSQQEELDLYKRLLKSQLDLTESKSTVPKPVQKTPQPSLPLEQSQRPPKHLPMELLKIDLSPFDRKTPAVHFPTAEERFTLNFRRVAADVDKVIQRVQFRPEDFKGTTLEMPSKIGSHLAERGIQGNNSVDQKFMHSILEQTVNHFHITSQYLPILPALKKIMVDRLFTRVHFQTKFENLHKLTTQLRRMVLEYAPPSGPFRNSEAKIKAERDQTNQLKRAYFWFMEASTRAAEILAAHKATPHGMSKPHHRGWLTSKDPLAPALGSRRILATANKVKGGHPAPNRR